MPAQPVPGHEGSGQPGKFSISLWLRLLDSRLRGNDVPCVLQQNFLD